MLSVGGHCDLVTRKVLKRHPARQDLQGLYVDTPSAECHMQIDEARAERVKDLTTPCFINLPSLVVFFPSISVALEIG